MNEINKADGELLRQKAEELLKKKSETEILELVQELAFQNEEKSTVVGAPVPAFESPAAGALTLCEYLAL